MLFKGIFL